MVLGQTIHLWQRQHEANAVAYAGFPLHSCSVNGHQGADGFRGFVDGCGGLRGRVLDIGCGPQPLPSYLQGYPTDLIAGIDPLAPTAEPHPFAFIQGYAEHLSEHWDTWTFQTVLAATSLDHVYDPGAVVRQVRRVLAPEGRFYVWATLWADAPAYDPDHPPAEMADHYHAFHLGPWFLDLAAREGFALGRHVTFGSNDYLEFV